MVRANIRSIFHLGGWCGSERTLNNVCEPVFRTNVCIIGLNAKNFISTVVDSGGFLELGFFLGLITSILTTLLLKRILQVPCNLFQTLRHVANAIRITVPPTLEAVGDARHESSKQILYFDCKLLLQSTWAAPGHGGCLSTTTI